MISYFLYAVAFIVVLFILDKLSNKFYKKTKLKWFKMTPSERVKYLEKIILNDKYLNLYQKEFIQFDGDNRIYIKWCLLSDKSMDNNDRSELGIGTVGFVLPLSEFKAKSSLNISIGDNMVSLSGYEKYNKVNYSIAKQLFCLFMALVILSLLIIAIPFILLAAFAVLVFVIHNMLAQRIDVWDQRILLLGQLMMWLCLFYGLFIYYR